MHQWTLRFFHVLAIVNTSARNTGVQISFSDGNFISFGKIPKSGIMNHLIVPFLIFKNLHEFYSISSYLYNLKRYCGVGGDGRGYREDKWQWKKFKVKNCRVH